MRKIKFELDGNLDVLNLEAKENTDIADVREALKAKCAPELDQFATAKLKLSLTTDGNVVELNPTASHSVIPDGSTVVIHHPPYKEDQGELNSLKRKVAEMEKQIKDQFWGTHENKVNLSLHSGEGSGNFAPFILSGPAKQKVETMLKVDTGATSHADIFLTPELAAELGLGEPEVYPGGVKGANGNCVDYPVPVRIALRLPNGQEKLARLLASSMMPRARADKTKLPTLPQNNLLCLSGQNKLKIKLDIEHYYIHELSESEAQELETV